MAATSGAARRGPAGAAGRNRIGEAMGSVGGRDHAAALEHRAVRHHARDTAATLGPLPFVTAEARLAVDGLEALAKALLQAAQRVGESAEVDRLRTLISDSDPAALAALGVD